MKTVSVPSMPTVEPAVSAGVSFHFSVLNLLTLTHTKTIMASQVPPSTQTSHSTLRPPSQGYVAGKRSVGRGDLDQALEVFDRAVRHVAIKVDLGIIEANRVFIQINDCTVLTKF
jgi:hypothetical protein